MSSLRFAIHTRDDLGILRSTHSYAVGVISW